MPTSSHSFKRIYLLSNRRATNWQRVDRLYQSIVKAYQPDKHIELDLFEDKIEPTKKIRKAIKKWNKDTLVCIGGGDGTVSFVVHELLMSSQKSSQARQSVLLPLWGGNANDLAIMLNGYLLPGSIKDLHKKAQPVDIFPLEVTIEPPEEPNSVRLAVSYASFGATAHATWAMEGSSHDRSSRKLSLPGVRLIAEVWDVFRALLKAESFDIEHDDVREQVYERIFTNGTRVAKLDGLPVHLNEQKYFEASVDKKHFHFVWYGIKSFLHNSYGNVQADHTSFTIHHPTKAQIDGEVLDIVPNTRVTVAVHAKSVRMLTRQLKVKYAKSELTGA